MTTDLLTGLQVPELLSDRDPVRRPFHPVPNTEYALPYGRRTIPFPGGEAVVLGDPPAWLESVLRRSLDLLQLPPDWDGYGADPLDPSTVSAAMTILAGTLRNDAPVPSVVPTNRGGLQFEWHCGGIDLEVEIVASGKVVVAFEDASGEVVHELGSNLSRLVEILKRLPSGC